MNYQEIINGLSEQIIAELRQLRSEEVHPVRSFDESGGFIRTKNGAVDSLREMRRALEEIATQQYFD